MKRRGFVARFPVRPWRQRRHTAGINDALNAGALGREHHGAGALNVGPHELARLPRPESIIGRYVKDITDAAYGTRDRFCGVNIALRVFHAEPGKLCAGTGRAKERAYTPTGFDQMLDNGRTDKPACTGDQNRIARAHARLDTELIRCCHEHVRNRLTGRLRRSPRQRPTPKRGPGAAQSPLELATAMTDQRSHTPSMSALMISLAKPSGCFPNRARM